MKKLYILIISFLILSCSKNDDLAELRHLTNSSTPPATAVPSFVSMNLNGQEINFSSIRKERNAALKYFNFSAENDSIRVELKISSINQTGNSTGLILVGMYNWNLYKKNAEGGFTLYPRTDQWLGLYSDKPLTDEIVTGEFNFKTQTPGGSKINIVSNGKFRLLF